MSELPRFKIFLSSPGDVAEERALAEFVFRRLADEIADVAHLSFLIWEHEPLFGHTGFQQQIERPSQSDLVVTILWSRLGTRLPSDYAPAKGEPSPTGTEFEINDALASYAVRGKPNLLIYRKTPGPQIGLGSKDFKERSEQYRRLDEFCRETFYDEQGVATVAHHKFANSHDFERKLATHVRRWVDQVLHLPQSERFRPFWRGESPFRGLQSFDAEHQAVYFGRSEAMSDLTRRIRDVEAAAVTEPVAKLLLVQGMSGSGKTSLFKAGLLPRLVLRPVEGIAQWITLHLHPSESDPAMRGTGVLGVLASRLCQHVPTLTRLGTPAELAEELLSRPNAAAAKIETAIAADAGAAGIEAGRVRLLIYIDQLEEAFSNPTASIGEVPVIGAIVALCRSSSIWIAATIRSDFVHRLEAYPDLMQALGRNPSYTLLPPRPDELADMIREPARAAGLTWEERDGVSLDKELLRDATGYPEALPLLEYTLAELYERRQGRMLRWSEYGGGLRGALISAADEVVRGAGTDVDTAFRDVMRELVGVGEDGAATRRYASLTRFPAGSAARALLDRLVARRLCVTTDEGLGDGPVTSLAHEALIRSWPRAQQWLQRETALLRVRDELARDAAVWEYHKRAEGWLGVAPEKLAAIRQIEEAGLMPAGAAADYAQQSRRRGRRNRFVRRAALAGICSLTVVAGIAAWLALKQRDVARTEAATSDRTTQFMVGLFQLADPSENRGNAVTVKEVLDKGAKDIREGVGSKTLAHEPRVRAELLTAMGQAYSGLGLYKPAEELLIQARADAASQTVSDEVRVRALFASGATMYLAGNYEAAETTLRSAADLARKTLAPSDDLRSTALTWLADDLAQLGKYSESVALCSEALVADRERGPEHDDVLAQTLATLGSAQFYSGDLAAAEPPLREALRIREKFFGMHHALTAISLDNLGVLLYQTGRYDAALVIYRQALPIHREIYGSEHPEVATILNNLGRAALMAGQVDEAEPLLRQSLAMTEKFQGENHSDLVSPLNSLAMIDAYHDRLDAALSEIRRADAIARLPDQDELLDQVVLNEANFELLKGNSMRAAALLTEAKTRLEKAHPNTTSDAWRYAVWDAVNAQLLAANGDIVGAGRTLSAAQKIIVQRFGEKGFYNLLVNRRARLIAGAQKST
ncbi:MAG TPA: tetratricopeptide repeat protein [Steroidobacteraceae bacterium]